jgi:hypothetical protein
MLNDYHGTKLARAKQPEVPSALKSIWMIFYRLRLDRVPGSFSARGIDTPSLARRGCWHLMPISEGEVRSGGEMIRVLYKLCQCLQLATCRARGGLAVPKYDLGRREQHAAFNSP